MSNTERKKILNYRTASGILPNPVNIDYGEIAIGYKKDSEAIYIKNTANDIVDFTPISIVNLTYNELKNLRDNSKLKPSQYYRITDFVTTVANDPEAQSAGHPFDIIVMASEKDKLQEECYAIQNEGNTYFDNCNLAAWKIWYCLDNDNTKYMWADTAKGKGVIYRMIDEWQNDCPYDFKNVQFKRYAVADASSNGALADLNYTYIGYNSGMTDLSIPDQSDFIWMYTFSLYKENEYIDYSSNYLHGPFTEDISYFNSPKKGQCAYNTLSNTYGSVNIDGQFYVSLILNNIVLISEIASLSVSLEFPSEMIYNTFGTANFNMTLKDNPESNKFDNRCYNNIVDGYANTFGNNCRYNTFGNFCHSNTFGNYCGSNSFGNDCASNSFGVGCDANSFGFGCGANSFGEYCEDNTFGNSCSGNTFGNSCGGNTFGNSCINNSFGNYCRINTFGNNFQHNALGNDVNYIEIPTEKIYYTHILNGTKGTYSNKLTIAFTPETKYSQFAGLTSDGVLDIWVEADAPHDVVNITYNELKNLRDNSKLKPSQYYRITDFVTTVANDPEAQSAGHPFDIIVMASDKNKLQDECYAIQHEGDTYFANCNLAAWKIWYCLDNDNTKYAWADTVNGKGVIYRMIDEWQNDCPYDFKNVQFKRYAVADASSNGALADLNGTYIGYNSSMNGLRIPDQSNFKWAYTFSIGKRIDVPNDASMIGYNNKGYDYKGYYGDNIIKPSTCHIVDDVETNTPFCLNNIVWYDVNSAHHGTANNIIVESECVNMTLSGSAHHIGYDNRNLIMGTGCISITIGSGGDMNTFGDKCQSNTFGDNCSYNTFGNTCSSNSFGNNCGSNTFGNNCISNSFGNGCNNNTFGNECDNNTFKDRCKVNTFGVNCLNNTFWDSCESNTFGNSCKKNTFRLRCLYNTFGNYCDNNSFGNDCWYNSFGNECEYNTLGNDCHNNSFGNECIRNLFGNYFQYNAIGNDVAYIKIPTEKIYHTQILNGTQGTSTTNKLTIEFTPETKYSQFAGLTSDGVLETWVEADDSNGVDCGTY